MPLEEIPTFHLFLDSSQKPLKKEERQRLLDELRKKLEEVKELKRRLHLREITPPNANPITRFILSQNEPFQNTQGEKNPEKGVEELVSALQEIMVPPLELLKDKPLQKMRSP